MILPTRMMIVIVIFLISHYYLYTIFVIDERLKWPQTIMGREKAECRRRAVDSSTSNTECRLIRTYIDKESGERLCIYKRHGTGLDELTLSMSAFLNCQRDFMCKRTAK